MTPIQRDSTEEAEKDLTCRSFQGLPDHFSGRRLSAENVQSALERSGAFAADVSSAVETEGYKDRDKVREFIRAVREQDSDTKNH